MATREIALAPTFAAVEQLLHDTPEGECHRS